MKKRYILTGILLVVMVLALAACSGGGKKSETAWKGMEPSGHMELQYANQFAIDYYDGGYALITIADQDRFLLVPEDAAVPDQLDEGIVVIQKPVESTYLAASSAMDFYRVLDCLDQVAMTSTDSSDWSFPEVQKAIADGDMIFVGKYSAPDYETIVDENCGLAIESTMIYHSPEIKEKLEQMGVPVMVEHSSYETHPLGRMEWIKLYGLLCGKEEEAQKFFDDQTARLDSILNAEQTGKKVAFFYISSAGYVNVRKPGDYISRMIEMAGGTYALSDMKVDEDNALSTLNMQMEDFYAQANDADILIYNSTIEGGLDTLDQLYEKNKLFKEFKAAKSGDVWCTENNMFQQTTGAAEMISELYSIIHDEAGDGEELQFLHKIK